MLENTELQYIQYDNAEYTGTENNPYQKLVKAIDDQIESCQIHQDTQYICDSAFYDCKNLKTITIPNNVLEIGWYAFYDCSSLSEINIGSQVLNIGDCAFSGCVKATTLVIPKNVQYIGKYAFQGCTGLEEVRIGEGLKGFDGSVFSWCPNLKKAFFEDPYRWYVVTTNNAHMETRIDVNNVMMNAYYLTTIYSNYNFYWFQKQEESQGEQV